MVFYRSVAAVAGANGAAQALSFVAAPILTRLYAPEHFGQLGVFLALLGILTTVSTLRYEFAIPLCSAQREADQVLLLAILAASSTGFLTGCVLVLGWDLFNSWQATAPVGNLLLLLPPAVVAGGVVVALQQWNLRGRRYKRVAAGRLADSVATVSGQIVGGTVNGAGPGLLLGSVAGTATGAVVLGASAWPTVGKSRRDTSMQELRAIATRYRRFPLVATGAGLANSASALLPSLLIASQFGVVGAGLFLLPQRVLGAPTRVIGDAVRQVYIGEAGQLVGRRDRVALRSLYWSLLGRLLLVGIPVAAVIAAVAPALVPIVFGEEWRQSGQVLAILAVPFAIDLAVAPVSVTLLLLERQELQLLADVGSLAAVGMVFVTSAIADLSLLQTTALYSAVVVGSRVVHVMLSRRALGRGVGR